jgi:microsomal dipeptidase-like Zn-dependent dipeptidase
LLDEDIVEILTSGGLIGVSLDERMLGFKATVGLKSPLQYEVMSSEEFKYHFPDVSIDSLPNINPDEAEQEEQEQMEALLESQEIPNKKETHPLTVCLNIVHIIAVAKRRASIAKPWNQITLGSDFDGLIQPVVTCNTVTDFENLKDKLLQWLVTADKIYHEENPGDLIFAERGNNKNLLNEIVDSICYDSGRNFLQAWL